MVTTSTSAPIAPVAFDPRFLPTVVLDEAIVECNPAFCRMLGFEREGVLGRTFLEVSPEVQSDGAFSQERWQRRWHAARAGLPQWFPWQFRNAEGRRAHALVHLATGEGKRLVAQVHDLTRLADAGWTGADVVGRVQQVLDHFKAVIAVKDCHGRYLFANRELERAVRTPAESIVGRTDAEIWPEEIAERFRANDERVLREERGIEFEVTATVARQLRTFLTFKFPLYAFDGRLYGLCGIAADVTERKRTQDALTQAALAVSSAQGATVLQELVRYLATILEVDAALIASPREDSNCEHMRMHALYMDGEIQANLEYAGKDSPCATVIGQTFRIYPVRAADLFPEDADFRAMGMESYAGFPLASGSGTPIGLIAVMSRKPMMNAEFIESILKIFAVRAAAELERQKAEETLRRSEASYRAIFEASEDAVFIHDWDTGEVIDVNRRACEIYGYSYEEMKHLTIGDVSAGEYPYTGAEGRRWLEEAKAGRPVRIEWHRRNKDGSLHWDEVVLRPAVIAGERRILAFTREITERKQAEQALRQAQKMEALGHLTGGIAHDFNNLLTSIMGYVVLAAEHPSAAAEPRLARYLEQAQASCTRARDLIQQMLTFSRGQRGHPRPVALPELVRQSVKLFRSSLPSTLEIETALEDDVPAVLLDPVHLDQILLNLCLNARDAMSGVGTVRVSLHHVRLAEATCTACRQTSACEYVQLCVEDDGSGIDPEIVDRIFEPFFTTKEVGKGSGMGLASVHGIVHELGGHIVVDTAVGRGTRFCVLFPALAAETDPEARNTAARARPRRPQLSGRVLVVDDEQSVAAFMRDLLESWGLVVSVAASAAEALALVARAPDIDLIVTDQMMPRTTGLQLAHQLASHGSEIPVILYTGFNEGLSRSEIEAGCVRALVRKPVDPHELFGLLQTHLPHRGA